MGGGEGYKRNFTVLVLIEYFWRYMGEDTKKKRLRLNRVNSGYSSCLVFRTWYHEAQGSLFSILEFVLSGNTSVY